MRGDVVTVFGGSGFIGKYVVRALCKAGARVRVATRRPHLAQDLKVMGDVGQVQLVQANVRIPESVVRALDGADAAVNLVGILFEAGPQKFADVQSEGARAIAEAAAARGIARFIHMSAIGANAAGPSKYAETKAKGERAVLDAVPSATILRPSIVFGPEDGFFNRFADMARFNPVLPLIGGGKTRFQPVYVGDVAEAVVKALALEEAKGRTYELGGPKTYSFKGLLQFILQTIDRPRFLAPVPFGAAWGLGLSGEILGALPFVEPFLTRDQVTLLKRDNVVSDKEDIGVIQDLGIEPETVEAIVPSYLVRYRRYGQFHEKRPV